MKKRLTSLHIPENPAPPPSPGFTEIANRYIDLMPAMGASAWAVYCQLARHAAKDGRCWPSIRLLAKLTRLNKETVVSSIDRLEKLRLVKVQRQIGKSTIYWVRHRQ